jgi:hypothetical protein
VCAVGSDAEEQRRGNGDVVLTISGSLQADCLDELSTLLGTEGKRRRVVLDLKDLVIADDDAIRFLCACERDGIVLRNCPRYIRAWKTRE